MKDPSPCSVWQLLIHEKMIITESGRKAVCTGKGVFQGVPQRRVCYGKVGSIC